MISSFTLFGKEIPLYGVCFYLGVGLATLVALLIARKVRFSRWEIVYSAIFMMIGALVGAKLLFLAVSWKEIVQYQLSLLAAIKGGFVFYGGLIGGAFGLWIYCKIYREKFMSYADIYATVLPLGHAIGRVGCFFAGCCYGMPSSFGVVYHSTVGNTPLGVKLLPIQLIEALCLLLLFFVMIVLYLKKQKAGFCTLFYGFSYAVIRFVLEFFRGDQERGAMWGLSTSQWICILLMGAVLYGACCFRKAKYLFAEEK